MNDAPRRAMTQQERETLSSPEQISRALREPANVSPGRRSEPEVSDAEWNDFLERERKAPSRRKGDVYDRVLRARHSDEIIKVSKADYLLEVVGLMLEEIAHLERCVNMLRDRPQLKYCGVWRDGVHEQGSFVTHSGALWYAHVQTSRRPGTSDDWQMATKTR
jgi:hypothetical protein